MSMRGIFALNLAGAFFICPSILLGQYSIIPLPANTVLAPNGPLPIPQVVQQFGQGAESILGVNDSGQMALDDFTAPGVHGAFYLPMPAYGLSSGIHSLGMMAARRRIFISQRLAMDYPRAVIP